MQYTDHSIRTLYDAAGQARQIQAVEKGFISLLADHIDLPFVPMQSL
ncbi:hypothetical protein NP590_03640 [Methylomonas sp. SURF-2]|uniref:Uncharacterized protein n=1 Tax=Methylomonas subterranea TaxID=2952225 RepID=A0ABT1TCK9_9GAMM|nr:hypothetical protein [Methylomonas sp. SURF-2]MCQ8103191.1 hypothetical protein [Methylomonas sp. SURF-2]